MHIINAMAYYKLHISIDISEAIEVNDIQIKRVRYLLLLVFFK